MNPLQTGPAQPHNLNLHAVIFRKHNPMKIKVPDVYTIQEESYQLE
jgi:hypothetical protein